jgi:hypothetical protein
VSQISLPFLKTGTEITVWNATKNAKTLSSEIAGFLRGKQIKFVEPFWDKSLDRSSMKLASERPANALSRLFRSVSQRAPSGFDKLDKISPWAAIRHCHESSRQIFDG